MSYVCHKKWILPSGATHLYVNCTADKVAMKDKLSNYDNDPYMEQEKKAMREVEATAILSVVILVLGCCGCIFCFSRFVVIPYKEAQKLHVTSQETEGLAPPNTNGEPSLAQIT